MMSSSTAKAALAAADAATKSTAAAAAAIAAPPAPPAPASASSTSKVRASEEDQGQDGGASIDTFQEYQPTALPDSVIQLCNNYYYQNVVTSTSTSTSTSTGENKHTTNADKVPTLAFGKENHNTNTMTTTTTTATSLVDIVVEDGETIIDLTTDESLSSDASNLLRPSKTILDDVTTTPSTAATSTFKLSQPHQQPQPSKKSVKLMIPSHPSSACESALLASVSAPKIPMETAECLLPLLMMERNNDSTNGDQRSSSSVSVSVSSSSVSTNTPLPLSPLQLEGVLLAIQRHRRVFVHPREGSDGNGGDGGGGGGPTTTKVRAGFFLGDGAGIGKGRQISAIIRDSCCRSRLRHVWLSVSRELIQDAKRDLTDIGVHLEVHDGTTFLGDSKNAPGLGRNQKGILFLTYNLLVSTSRLEQIIAWLAGTEHIKKPMERYVAEQKFDGLIVFDEAHKAKNLLLNTKTAQLVVALQQRLPNARVVYASATGVSDIGQLAYVQRLGLWGHGTQFPNFSSFQHAMEQRGMGAMELLAMELKSRGCFVARTLSWEGADFETLEVDLDRNMQRIYDNSCEWFRNCKREIESAFRVFGDNIPGQYRAVAWRVFYACQQRFFKEMAICGKIEHVSKQALQHIQEGKCVVIGLQSTGESSLQTFLDGMGKGAPLEEKKFESIISTLAVSLQSFLKQHFPVTSPPPELPKLPERVPNSDQMLVHYRRVEAEIARIQSLPPPQPNPQLVARRQLLLDAIHNLGLPPNPLDDLIDRLGGQDIVAELTGRSGRILRNKDGTFGFFKREVKSKTASAVASDESDRINLVERRAFMDGKKTVAIISDAASTGISLHAAKGAASSGRRRVHVSIELPWSGDKAVQQLGRSHRSGQETAPLYANVVSNLGGERRFAAAVSKRLASLGALCQGDRRGATGADFSSFDLDTKYGKVALKRLYQKLQDNEMSGVEEPQSSNFLPARNAAETISTFLKELKRSPDPMLQALPWDKKLVMQSLVLSIALKELEDVGLDREARKKSEVKAFLNRIAGICVARQALVFGLFMGTLEDIVKEAKVTGEYDASAEEISATRIKKKDEVDLIACPSSGAMTKMATLSLDRGVSFEMICEFASEEANKIVVDKCDETPGKEKNEERNNVPDVDADDDLDGFIVNDDDDDDEWMETAKSKKKGRAEPGFYISKNKIAGRHLILFAKGKFNRTLFESDDELLAFDPLCFMQVTRPNTGISHTDMATSDLKRKYRMFLSCTDLKLAMDGEAQKKPEVIIDAGNKRIGIFWKAAYTESDFDKNMNGLAPRRREVVLIHGPILHIMTSLQNTMQFRTGKETGLKVMRAVPDDGNGNRGNKIVGVRFPSDEDAKRKLFEELRKREGKDTKYFDDEPLEPVNEKASTFALSQRKTMTSFFKTKPMDQGHASSTTKQATPAKRSGAATSRPSSSVKKPKASVAKISSFFRKK